MDTTPQEGSVAGQWRALAAWLATGDARSAARHELQRRGLGFGLADDLLQLTLSRLGVTLMRGGPRPEPFEAAGYARRSLAHAAGDMLRGQRRHPEQPAFEPNDIEWVDNDECVAGDVAGRDLEDRCRRSLHGLLAGRPWAASSALSVLTFACHPHATVPREAPRPAEADLVGRWAALWLAGRADCFGPSGEDRGGDAAVRQRRSRALKIVEQLLRDAAVVAGVGAEVEAR